MKIITFTLLCTLFSCTSPSGTFRLTRQYLFPAMEKVANWQIANFTYRTEGSPYFLHDHGIDAWTNATLFLVMSCWAGVAADEKYAEWLLNIGNTNGWKVPDNLKDTRYGLYHADELCIIQFYQAMYRRYRKPEMLEATRARLDYIIQNPPDTS